MKRITIYFALLACVLLSACDFNINDGPGRHWSSSIKQSKRRGAFICAYTVKDSTINKLKIKEIFVEKQIWRGEGFFATNTIDCCSAQLIIISDGPFSYGKTGYGFDWFISGFDPGGMSADYKGTVFPETIPIEVVVKGEKGNTVTKYYLTKVKDDDKSSSN